MPFEDVQLICPGAMLTALQQYKVNFGLIKNNIGHHGNEPSDMQLLRPPKFGDSAQTTLTMASLPTESECFEHKV